MKTDKKLIYTVLEAVAKAKTKDEKIKILKDNESMALKAILKGGLDKSLNFTLPPGAPPYSPLGSDEPSLRRAVPLERYTHLFPQFVRDLKGLDKVKAEGIFLKVLQTIHPKDAELVLLMKDCALKGKYKGLTLILVKAAFPDLIKE